MTRCVYPKVSYIFTELFEIFELSLREQEHCFSLLSLAIRTTPVDEFLIPLFLCFLIVLKVKDPETYKNLFSGKMSPDELLIYASSKANQLMSTNYGARLEAYIRSCPHEGNQKDLTRLYEEKINNATNSDEHRSRNQQVLKTLEGLKFGRYRNILDYLTKKIEIASRFNTK